MAIVRRRIARNTSIKAIASDPRSRTSIERVLAGVGRGTQKNGTEAAVFSISCSRPSTNGSRNAAAIRAKKSILNFRIGIENRSRLKNFAIPTATRGA